MDAVNMYSSSTLTYAVWLCLVTCLHSQNVGHTDLPTPTPSGNPSNDNIFVEVRVDVWGLECFYQELPTDAELHVEYQVVKGGDRSIDFRVHRPNGKKAVERLYDTKGEYDHVTTEPGVYAICFENMKGQFGSKLLTLVIMTSTKQDWHDYVEEIEFKDTVKNVTVGLGGIHRSVQIVRRLIAKGKQENMLDLVRAEENMSLVQNMSLAMCTLIMLCSAFQVYFVRRLFSSTAVTSSGKPRA